MDWNYKHFAEQAVFNAPMQSVLEAARSVGAKELGPVQETAEGFTARGYRGFHTTLATFRAASGTSGTELKVELEVKRFSLWGYILWDPFGFYSAMIDKWFSEISQRLSPGEDQAVVSKTTRSYRVQRGCLAGCLVWFVVAACLGTAGVAVDQQLFPQLSGSTPGPLTAVASMVAIAAGVLAFLYVRHPDGRTAKFINARLGRDRGRGTG